MRAGAPPISCLQSAAPHHHHHPPSCSPEVQPARHQQQHAPVDCILHLWRFWPLRCRRWTLSVAWTSFQNLKHTSHPPSFLFCWHPPSEFPSNEPSSLQAALCGLLEEGGGEGDRPKRCHGQPLNLGLRDGLPKVDQICPSGQPWGCQPAQAYRPSQQNMSKGPQVFFFHVFSPLQLWVSKSSCSRYFPRQPELQRPEDQAPKATLEVYCAWQLQIWTMCYLCHIWK